MRLCEKTAFALLALLSGVWCLEEKQIQVSELPLAKFEPPVCNYTVREEHRDGLPVARSVSVGDVLYHRWSCLPTAGLYCIMVHSCSISSSGLPRAKRVEIIDEFGCAVFPELTPNMQYPSDTEAGLRAAAFLVDIDQPSIMFRCSLKYLVKVDSFCRRPLCSRPGQPPS